MANLTLAIDDELLRSARVEAVQQGTRVNDICREAIERFASDSDGDAFQREPRAVAARGRRRAAARPEAPETQLDALRLAVEHRLSGWDAMVVQAALQAGRRFGNLEVVNPFEPQAREAGPSRTRGGRRARRA